MPPEAAHGRNSRIRETLKKPVDLVVNVLDDLGITADQTTLAGLALTVAFSLKVSQDNQKPRSERMPWYTSAALLLFSRSPDFLDGSLARKQGTHNPLLDVAADRISETAVGLTIMWSDPNSRLAALASVITAPLPSRARAWAEFHGREVPESSLGSYPVRVATTTIAQVFPEISAPVLTAQSLANVKTTVDRINHQSETQMTEKAQKEAKNRFIILSCLTALTLVAGLGLYSELERSK